MYGYEHDDERMNSGYKRVVSVLGEPRTESCDKGLRAFVDHMSDKFDACNARSSGVYFVRGIGYIDGIPIKAFIMGLIKRGVVGARVRRAITHHQGLWRDRDGVYYMDNERVQDLVSQARMEGKIGLQAA